MLDGREAGAWRTRASGRAATAALGKGRRAPARASLARSERAMDHLSLACRAAYVLRELERLSPAETASILGTTPDAVRLQVTRARIALTLALGGAEVGADAYVGPGWRSDRMVAEVMARIRARSSSKGDGRDEADPVPPGSGPRAGRPRSRPRPRPGAAGAGRGSGARRRRGRSARARR